MFYLLYTIRCTAKLLQLRDLYILYNHELHFFEAHLVVNIKGDGPAAWYFWCSLKPEEDVPPPHLQIHGTITLSKSIGLVGVSLVQV